MSPGHPIICQQCDALYHLPKLAEGERARCERCGDVLAFRRKNALQRSAAFSLGAAILFVVANAFPFISIEAAGQSNTVTLAESVIALHSYGSVAVAWAVAVFIIVAPAVLIACNLYVMLPLMTGRVPAAARSVCRWMYSSSRWSMTEVFLLGVIVSLLKLVKLATVDLGVSFWAFAGLMFCLAGALANIDRVMLWEQIDNP